MGGAANFGDAVAQGNRYAALAVEVEEDGTGDRFQLCRIDGQLWLVDARRNPNVFPELTESAFARMVCTTRRFAGDGSFITAVHVTHAEPPYRAEYERIFRVPVTFGSIRPVTTRSWRIVVHKRPRRLSWATAIENRWAATVVVGGIFVRCVVGLLRLYWYPVRNINRTARREKRALLMAMSPLKKWRVRVPRDQWVDAATRLGEKLASGLNTVRTQ